MPKKVKKVLREPKRLKHLSVGAALASTPHVYHAVVHAVEAKELTAFMLERSAAFTALVAAILAVFWFADKGEV